MAFALLATHAQNKAVYMDKSEPVEKRVKDLLSKMTLEEKVAQMCQYVGLEHMKIAEKELSAEDMKKSHAQGFYANLHSSDVEDMTKKGMISSFLHVVNPEEANYLQSLAQQSRLKIPLLVGIDAIHGTALVSGATVYPTPIGQASTFDPSLIEVISKQTALEMRATGSHWTFTPNVEVARDARWGRVGETFGEDPYLVGQMGAATVRGLQGKDFTGYDKVIANAKHMVGGSEPINGINGAPADMSERTLREVFLPPFKACVDAGVFTVMTAHNELNGVPCHANKYLMTEILRNEWKFSGFIVSDWMDIERLHDYHTVAETYKDASFQSVDAGMDMHMHGPDFYDHMLELVKEGKISEERITQSVALILEAKFKLGLFENPYIDTANLAKNIFTKTHQESALDVARKSIVLLKNENNILPLAKGKYKNILVTGPNANNQSILGDWAFEQPEANVVTVLQGLKKVDPSANYSFVDFGWNLRIMDPKKVEEAVDKAKKSDLAIVVVGENSMRYHWNEKTSGENSDRYDLSLVGLQEELVQGIYATGVPTIVVLSNGRPLSTEWIAENISTIIEGWEPGSFGGQAIAEIIFGDVNPSGKLPITIPRHSGQIQSIYNHKFTSKWFPYATGNSSPLFEFGFGLSYNQYEYGKPVLSTNTIGINDNVKISFTVTNKGKYAGDEIVQLYIKDDYSSATRPVKELKDFTRVSLKAGETKTIDFTITPDKLAYYNANMKYGVEAGTFTVMVGSSSRDNDLQKATFTVK